MLLGKYHKRPTERKRYNVDFSVWLDDDELVEEVTFVVTPQTEPVFDVDEYHLVDGKIVVFYVSGGQPGVKYDVELRAITSKGDTEVNTIAYNVTAR